MKKSHKLWIVIGGLLVVTLAGAGALGLWAWTTPVRTALAQQSNPTATPSAAKTFQAYRDFFIQQFASRLGVTTDKLKEAYSGAYSDMLDQEVKDGKITQAQADQIKKDLANQAAQGNNLPGFGPGEGRGHGFGKGGMHGMPGFGDEMGLASFAKALNMTQADLATELQSGKTIADVAKEKNVDIAQVKTSVLADLKAALDTQVTNGRITQAQADTIYNNASTKFDTIVNQAWMKGGMHGMPGFGFRNELSLASFAKALNMTEADLTSALQSGQTIAQIAKGKNIDLAQVKTSVLADLKANLDQQVTNGRLTQTQADTIYNNAGTMFDNMVNQTMPAQQWRGPRGWGG